MNSLIKRFLIELIIGIGITFVIHIGLLKMTALPLLENSIVLSYTVNIFLALVIFLGLFLVREKLKNQIGFLFMGGSFLKFIVFFIFFYPIFRYDGQISSLEFASFFVPYAVCLLIETLGVIRILRD